MRLCVEGWEWWDCRPSWVLPNWGRDWPLPWCVVINKELWASSSIQVNGHSYPLNIVKHFTRWSTSDIFFGKTHLTWWFLGETSWMSISWLAINASSTILLEPPLSTTFNIGLHPLWSKYSMTSVNTFTINASVRLDIGWMMVVLLPYKWQTMIYTMFL